MFIIDVPAVPLNQNLFKKKVRKADPRSEEYRWGYSTTKGYYLGFKLMPAVEYPSLVPVTILMHAGSAHDSKLFSEFRDDFKCRMALRIEDTAICDRYTIR
jgi:hypothetical protein